MRWPEGPPHLALNPPYLFFLCFVFWFFCFCFLGGFKGQVRWPEGPPHLALNPPYFLVFFVCFRLFVCLFVLFFWFFFVFVSFLCFWVTKKTSFPPEKGHFCLFLSVSLCFSWAFFGLPLLQFLFLCLSLVLFFLSSFLSFFFGFLLVPSFSLFLSFCVVFGFVSWKLTTSKDSIAKFFFHQSRVFFGFLSCFLFQIPLSYLCCSWYSVMFLFNINVLVSKKNQVEKHQFFVQRGVATKRVFLITCVLQNVKSYRFLPLELIKGPLFPKKRLVPQNGAFQELLRGPT